MLNNYLEMIFLNNCIFYLFKNEYFKNNININNYSCFKMNNSFFLIIISIIIWNWIIIEIIRIKKIVSEWSEFDRNWICMKWNNFES